MCPQQYWGRIGYPEDTSLLQSLGGVQGGLTLIVTAVVPLLPPCILSLMGPISPWEPYGAGHTLHLRNHMCVAWWYMQVFEEHSGLHNTP